MANLAITQNNKIVNWEKRIGDSRHLSILQQRIDEAEKDGRELFSDFNDLEMLQWFLLKQEHLDETKDKSPRTREEYKRDLVQFVKYLVEYQEEIGVDITEVREGSLFKSLDERHIRRYQEWLATKSPHVKRHGSYSPYTLARKTTVLRNFLSFLYMEGYIDKPIHKGLKKATVNRDDAPDRDLGPVEVKQLLDHFKKNGHIIAFALIHVLVTTGIRNEELCRLKVKDIKYDTIHGEYYLDVMGKGNKRRQVPLRDKTVESIRMFRSARGLVDFESADKEQPLFTTNRGKAYSPSYLSQYLKEAIKSSNLPFVKNRDTVITPHTFRHAFAIISKMSGADLYDIMRSLGHARVDTTMIYLNKVFERENHAIHKWNSEIFSDYI